VDAVTPQPPAKKPESWSVSITGELETVGGSREISICTRSACFARALNDAAVQLRVKVLSTRKLFPQSNRLHAELEIEVDQWTS
jgi:hypothetical protein